MKTATVVYIIMNPGRNGGMKNLRSYAFLGNRGGEYII